MSQTIQDSDASLESLSQPLLAPIPKIARPYGLKPWFVYELIRQDKLPPGVVVRFGPRTTRINCAKWAEFVEAGGLEQAR